MNMTSNKSNVNAFLLASFLGIFGIHRFYVGKYISGIIQFLTLGAFGIWALIDWLDIIYERFTDSDDNKLVWSKDKEGQYAGLGIRLCAHSIDSIILGFIVAILLLIFILISLLITHPSSIDIFNLFEDPMFLIISVAYYTILTASNRQGSFGKKIVGIIVVNQQMKPLSMIHSFARCCSYLFSYMTLGIGFIMIYFTKDHTGLHDKIAGTYVIYSKKNSADI